MNNLSWLIYLADVSESAQGKIGFLAFGLIVAFLLIAFVSTCDRIGPFQKPAKWRPSLFIVGVGLLFVNVFIPDKNTIYAIAASEMGEEVVKSETAGKAMKALDAWLDHQIAPGSDPS